MDVSATRQLMTLLAACSSSEALLVETALSQLEKSVEHQVLRRLDGYEFPDKSRGMKAMLQEFTYATMNLRSLYQSKDRLWSLIQQADVPFKELSIGKIVRFGSYQKEPLLWQVLNVGDKGELLLISTHIITCKAFATQNEEAYGLLSDQERFGSNNWEISELRVWLNSTQRRVNYLNRTPVQERVWNGFNAYEKEKGFLADGNFTEVERRLLYPRTHQVALGAVASEGTSEDQGASLEVTDLVSLASVQEVMEWMLARGWDLNTSLTKGAAEGQDLRTITVFAESPWHYLLIDPQLSTGHLVQMVTANGEFSDCYAYDGTVGIRPVICLCPDTRLMGTGTWDDPFCPKWE